MKDKRSNENATQVLGLFSTFSLFRLWDLSSTSPCFCNFWRRRVLHSLLFLFSITHDYCVLLSICWYITLNIARWACLAYISSSWGIIRWCTGSQWWKSWKQENKAIIICKTELSQKPCVLLYLLWCIDSHSSVKVVLHKDFKNIKEAFKATQFSSNRL